MLRQAVVTSNLSVMDVVRKLGIDKSLLSRTLAGTCYRAKSFYDELYDLLENYEGITPSFENVRAYPSGKELGTWDVYIDGEFFITWRFYDYSDMLKFVHKDERFKTLEKYFIKDTMFRNTVRLK